VTPRLADVRQRQGPRRVRTTVKRPKADAAVRLLCPKCRSRLPIAGDLRFVGQVGYYCRHCKATILITMEVIPEGGSPSDGEPENPQGQSH
jgi:hypothetical protein